jgi:hypothetical protein
MMRNGNERCKYLLIIEIESCCAQFATSPCIIGCRLFGQLIDFQGLSCLAWALLSWIVQGSSLFNRLKE